MGKLIKKQLDKIEKSPGVYIFRDAKNKILYIGKARNLRARVRSYFIGSRDSRPLIPRIVDETAKIGTAKTNSEVEAILLEAKLIRKIQPPYNTRQKDDKSFIYIFINFSDPIPRVRFVRQKEMLLSVIPAKAGIQKTNRFRIKSGMTIQKKDKLFGPFISATEIRKLLNYFRRIIPFRDCANSKFKRYQKLDRGCQWAELGKCSAPCVGASGIKEYRQNILKLSRLLSGGINRVKKELWREMKKSSVNKDYEQAAEVRDKIKTIDHIKEVSMIDDYPHIGIYTSDVWRGMWGGFMVEAVDLSNISGVYAAGSVVRAKADYESARVEFDKSGYRRFKIRTKSEPDDVGMIREVIKRRFNHSEWKFPDLLIIDGGKGQLKAAESELISSSRLPTAVSNGKKINLVAIAKGPTRRGEELFFSRNFDPKLKSTLIKNKRVVKLMRDEAHRFALSYHKLLRKKGIMGI